MPLIAAALAPNSPLLLPGLAARAKQAVAKTTAAVAALGSWLAAHTPDVVVLVATGTDTTSAAPRYALLQAPRVAYEFAEFGDLTTSGSVSLAFGFTHRLKERCETSFPIPLLSAPALPYIFSVPLVGFATALADVPVACLQLPRQVPPDELQRLAHVLGEHCSVSSERVALVSVGVLGEQLGSNDPDAPIFDKQFLAAMVAADAAPLLNLDPGLRSRVRQTLWEPAVLLRTLLAQRTVKSQVLSYESPLGVGLITASIDLG